MVATKAESLPTKASRMLARDRHQRVVLAVVGAGGGAKEAVDEIADAVEDEVPADVAVELRLLAALVLGQAIRVQADLVEVRGRLGDGGDRHDGDAEDRG